MALRSLYHRKTLSEGFMSRKRRDPLITSVVERVRRAGGEAALSELVRAARSATIPANDARPADDQPNPP